MITRCSNNYGTHHFPEKLIPLFITNLLEDKKVPVYGNGKNVRDWLHVDDHCRGIFTVLQKGKSGEVYNAGGRQLSCSIIEAVTTLENLLDKKAKLNYNPIARTGDHRWYISDMNKFKKAYNWNNKKSLMDIYEELCK